MSTVSSLVHRPGVGATAGILQPQELVFKRLFIDQPVLVVVEHGTKCLRWQHGELITHAGEAIAIAGGQAVDIINRPAEDGSYRACWLAWDSALVAEHGARHPDHPVIRHAQAVVPAGNGFLAAFHQAVQSIDDADIPLEIARHRAAELLLWVGMYAGRFEESNSSTLAVKVRRLLGQDLAKDWSAEEVASRLAMSEASLRRKLATENTSLSEIMIDARMTFALTMLQSTAQPVTSIALDCGYQSPSHFAVRFKQRFGFSPSAVRERNLQPRAAHAALAR